MDYKGLSVVRVISYQFGSAAKNLSVLIVVS